MLNEPQAQAVSCASENLIVLAGAGSGKTRVLVHRIVWLISECGLFPHNIMAVTFTNKAARELKERINSLLPGASSSMMVGTFHSVCHQILRACHEACHLPRDFQLIDSDDQLRLVKRLMREMQIDENRWQPKQVQGFINKCKDLCQRSNQVGSGDFFHQTMARIYQRYEEACRVSNLVDFGELLLTCSELWQNAPQIREHYQRKFRHLLVDEFQDTNHVQYRWLELLARDQVPVTIVGDDDQSIYGWRGAQIENLTRFKDEFAHVELIRLEQNYRSTKVVLEAANQVIGNNANRMGKRLWTDQTQGSLIKSYAALSDFDESRWIAETLQQHHIDGKRYSDMAVLYRSNAQTRVLEEQLLARSMPYRIYGGLRFYERAEIKNAIAYVRLIFNPKDDTAFERVVNLPPRGIGEKTLAALREQARMTNQSLWQCLETAATTDRGSKMLEAFRLLVLRQAEKTASMNLADRIECLINDTGLFAYHTNEKGKLGDSRTENLTELVRAARQFEEGCDEDDVLEAFLAHVSLEASEHQADEHEDAIQLMTLHSAKGLEFPIVVISGMEEGLFPHRLALNDTTGLEEERRLCYVGITRAMEQLYLTYAESRMLFGSVSASVPSRFLSEIPKHLVEEVRMQSNVGYAKRLQGGAFTPPRLQAKDDAAVSHGGQVLQAGGKVQHKLFGNGVVLSIDGEGDSAKIQVNFDKHGTKWLVVAYAKLVALD